MLVLSRRTNERIVIGENVIVTVVGIQGGRVKLGITAPHDVSIRRSELERRPPAELSSLHPQMEEASV